MFGSSCTITVTLPPRIPSSERFLRSDLQGVELCSSQGLVEREVGFLADCLPLVCDSHLHWDSLSLHHPRTPLQQILLDHPGAQHKDFRVIRRRGRLLLTGIIPDLEQLDALNPRHHPEGSLVIATVGIHPISTTSGVQAVRDLFFDASVSINGF